MDYKDLLAGQTNDNFWFKAKNDLIKVLFEKAGRGRTDLKILNIGAGTGDDLKVLNEFGKNYVLDINESALARVDETLCVEKKIADASQLPYPDDFFDMVASFDVFEHIKEDRLAAAEAFRVLKPGGALIFTVPACQFLFSSHDRALEHFRRYGKNNLKKLFSSFDDLKLFSWNSLLFAPLAAIRLINKKSKPKVDRANLPAWLNNIFFRILKIDNFLIKRGISLPIGLSLVGYCFKKINL